eukprot:4977451-Ditylum_brightwellii.AAC.1
MEDIGKTVGVIWVRSFITPERLPRLAREMAALIDGAEGWWKGDVIVQEGQRLGPFVFVCGHFKGEDGVDDVDGDIVTDHVVVE